MKTIKSISEMSCEDIEKQVQRWSDSKLANFLGISIEAVYESPPSAVGMVVDKISIMNDEDKKEFLEEKRAHIAVQNREHKIIAVIPVDNKFHKKLIAAIRDEQNFRYSKEHDALNIEFDLTEEDLESILCSVKPLELEVSITMDEEAYYETLYLSVTIIY